MNRRHRRLLFILAIGLVGGLVFPVRDTGLQAPTTAGPVAAKRERPRSVRIPEDVRRHISSIRSIKDRDARMQEVMRLAATLPVADLERWYRGNYLEFLDSETESLFYMVADQRWMEADPAGIARYKIETKQRYPDPYLAAWLKADESAAMAYIDSLDPARRKELALPLARVTAKTDLPRALTMWDELKKSKAGESYQVDDLFYAFAKQDREVVLAHIRDWPAADRDGALNSIARAWIEKDFVWSIKLLQSEGKGPADISRIFNSSDGWGKPAKLLAEHAASLPPGWIEELAKSAPLDSGCGDQWLAMRPPIPGIPDETLAKIQLKAASGGFWDNDKLEPGKHLLEHADWLPFETRAELAKSILRTWRDGPEAAAAWVATLDDELRDETEKQLQASNAATSRNLQSMAKQPAELIKALSEASERAYFGKGPASWDQAEIAEAVSAVGNLDPAVALRMIDGGSIDLPPAVKARLAEQSLPAGKKQQEVNHTFAQIASEWAVSNPAAAAKWVEGLPEGEARTWAARNVVLRWSSYSPAAAKAWEAKLGMKR